MKKLYILLVLLLLFVSLNAQEKTAIICGNLITGNEDKAVANKVIIIQGERIVAIGDKKLLKPEYKQIDLSDFTVLPGLIDAHVHPLISGDDYQYYHLRGSSASKALHGLKTVQNYLQEGWTSVRVAGDSDVHYAHFEIRDAINKGLFDGPRIYGAGHYLSVTGGGGDINFASPEQKLIADGLIVDGKDEMLKAVRNEIKNGSDWIKLLVTGAYMSAGDNPQNVHFSDEEIKIAIEEANRRDVPVMMHAHATEGIKKSIEFGARSIEHATFLDDETIDLFLKHGTYLIPTVYISEYFMAEEPDSEALSKANQLHLKYRDEARNLLTKAIKKGVKVGVGTDNVGFPPNYAAREFSELVSLGMTPMQAILAGTKLNAELLMKQDDLGTIDIGKYADIIAVKGDPAKDISELQRVKFVMKGGKVIKMKLE